MSVFDQLRPFVSLCQACGMIPYTMEHNLRTNKFAKFTFSFSHVTTWWFFLVMFLQLATAAVMLHTTRDVPDDLLIGRDVPITVNILLLVKGVCNLAELTLSRWIVSRYLKLRKMIEAIQEMEKLLGEEFISQHKNSVTTRFVTGFILVILTVSKKN
jgi:hypothetical protein